MRGDSNQNRCSCLFLNFIISAWTRMLHDKLGWTVNPGKLPNVLIHGTSWGLSGNPWESACGPSAFQNYFSIFQPFSCRCRSGKFDELFKTKTPNFSSPGSSRGGPWIRGRLLCFHHAPEISRNWAAAPLTGRDSKVWFKGCSHSLIPDGSGNAFPFPIL